MPRKPTEAQQAVLDKLRELGHPARTAEVIDGWHGSRLPSTTGTARDRLESMCKHGWVRRLPGVPAHYELVTEENPHD